MTIQSLPTLLLAALALSACSTMKGAARSVTDTVGLGGEEEPAPSAYPWEGAEDPGEVPLLSRDGGVVAGPGEGTTTVGAGPTRDVRPSTEGRMYIVELYQKALEERDELQLEVDGLVGALEHEQQQRGALALQLEASRAEEQRLAALVASLQGENVELAARLSTAQLRRLEAEKLLLEERLRDAPQPGAELPGESLTNQPDDAGDPGQPSAWDLALGGGGE